MLPLARAFVARRLQKHAAAAPGRVPAAAAGADRRDDAPVHDRRRGLARDALARGAAEGSTATSAIAILVIVWWQVGLWLSAAVTHLIDARRGHDVAGAEGAASLNILRFVGVLLVWVVAFLMLLANLGVKIGPLVAGLGIGGIAIALAVQNVLGDLFASLSIALDKPFRVGDFLVIGEEKGTVEQIGIKSTRLRSPDRRADRHVERRPAEEPGAELRPAGGAPRGAAAPHRLRDAAASPSGGARRSSRRRSAAQEKTRFERAHFARLRRLRADVRGGLLRAGRRATTRSWTSSRRSTCELLDEFARRGIEFAYPTTAGSSMPWPGDAAGASD